MELDTRPLTGGDVEFRDRTKNVLKSDQIEGKGVNLRARADTPNGRKAKKRQEILKRGEKAGLPTKQGVGCSNHPGRTIPFNDLTRQDISRQGFCDMVCVITPLELACFGGH